MDAYTKKLQQIKGDEKQYEAFLTTDNTVVLAGPGSGKTTVLTLKMMRLLQEFIHPPHGLACITFSRAAAKEFETRLRELGLRPRKNVFLGTVHSFCIAEVLSPFAELYNYDIPLPIRIVSESEKEKLFRAVVNSLGLDEREISIVGMDRERSLDISGLSLVDIPSYAEAARVAKEYEKRLRAQGKVDFVDIVKYSMLLIQEQEYVRKCLEAKFPWILIDEYQDLGRPLHEMVLALSEKTNIKIFAVGDPDQAIYSRNGALPDYLCELADKPNYHTVQLIRNYRSPQDIIDASELALGSPEKKNYETGLQSEKQAEFRFKVCELSMNDQYDKVATEIIPECLNQGIPLEEIAVLVGSKYQATALCKVLAKHSIPSYKAKHEFERSKVVVWLEQCATWVASNGTDASFQDVASFWLNLRRRHQHKISIDEEVDVKQKLYSVLQSSRQHSSNLLQWIRHIVNTLEIRQLLTDPIFPDEKANLYKLREVALKGEFKDYDLKRFSKLGKPDNQVTVSTRHSSKGLEFEVVIILGLEEGNFPHSRNVKDPQKLAEEHRVFFVCVSRSKRICYLVRSEQILNEGEITNKPSRFWNLLYEKYGSR